jgi:hypothetical protein
LGVQATSSSAAASGSRLWWSVAIGGRCGRTRVRQRLISVRRPKIIASEAPKLHRLYLLDGDQHRLAFAPLGGLVDLLDRVA